MLGLDSAADAVWAAEAQKAAERMKIAASIFMIVGFKEVRDWAVDSASIVFKGAMHQYLCDSLTSNDQRGAFHE